MTPADIDRVFGRSRLRMVTGDHVEVFREASAPGERRRYTKRFLATPDGDFREWTEREWRILARLVGHGLKPVPEVVQFDRGSADRPALVQTYDAGITVDHWATLLPLERDGVLLKNVFEDCAHWWALARHSLMALDAIHELRLVHLDLKADNVCIPAGPLGFDPCAGSQRSLHPRFDDITLIDFAFSLVSGERLKSALPIAAQPGYEYQSPRLLHALEVGRNGDLGETRHLDWRCDFFSLAAMLWRYLPELAGSAGPAWTPARHAKASAFVSRLIEVHDVELPTTRPHAQLITLATETLAQPDLRLSLQRGWTLALDAATATRAAPTPITRVAPPLVAEATPVCAMPAEPLRDGPRVLPVVEAAPVTPAATATPIAARTPAHTPIAVPHASDVDPESVPMAMHLEQSDIDARNAAARQLARRPTLRLWWGGAGIAAAVAAAASMPWLRTTWSSLADATPRVVAALVTREAPSTPAPRPPTHSSTSPPTSQVRTEVGSAGASAASAPAAEVDVPAPASPTRVATAGPAAPPRETSLEVTPASPSTVDTSPAAAGPAAPAAQPMTPSAGTGTSQLRLDGLTPVAPGTAALPAPASTARLPKAITPSQVPRASPALRGPHNAAADAAATARLAQLAKAEDNAAALMRARSARAALAAPVPAVPGPSSMRPADGATPWAVAGKPPPVSAPMASPTPHPHPQPHPHPHPHPRPRGAVPRLPRRRPVP